jgi:hypothetical protein
MIGLFFRLAFWSMGALIVLSVLALWAFCWLVVFGHPIPQSRYSSRR